MTEFPKLINQMQIITNLLTFQVWSSVIYLLLNKFMHNILQLKYVNMMYLISLINIYSDASINLHINNF